MKKKPTEEQLEKSFDLLLEVAREEIKSMGVALEREGLKLQQAQKMIEVQKLHISQLETIVIQVRNAVTPRGQQKPSAEMEPTHG